MRKGDVMPANMIYLVSYPKSGNTWMRFLLGTLLKEKVDWLNMNDVIPYIDAVTPNQLKKLPDPKIIKSHYPYDKSYTKVIYILRDVRDVMISMYYQMLRKGVIDEGFDSYFKRFINGKVPFGRWDKHVRGWMENKEKVPNGFLLVRYENLQRNTTVEVERILDFLEIGKSKKEIKEAMQWASFENMKSLEQKQLSSIPERKVNPFVRKGGSGNWKDILTKEQKQLVKQKYGKILIDLGYESSFNW